MNKPINWKDSQAENDKRIAEKEKAILDDLAKVAMHAICVNAGRNGFSFDSPSEIASKAYDIAHAMRKVKE